jgi:hypothetical protein
MANAEDRIQTSPTLQSQPADAPGIISIVFSLRFGIYTTDE